MPKASSEFVRQRVEDVIGMLGLDSCADIQIGNPLRRGLSGGQKRRVSIGCSLVTYPWVEVPINEERKMVVNLFCLSRPCIVESCFSMNLLQGQVNRL